jgi:hypothetical protein
MLKHHLSLREREDTHRDFRAFYVGMPPSP